MTSNTQADVLLPPPPLSPRPYNSTESIEQTVDLERFIAVRCAAWGGRIILRNCIFSNWDDAKMFIESPASQYEVFDDVENAMKYAFGFGTNCNICYNGGETNLADSLVEQILPPKKPGPPVFPLGEYSKEQNIADTEEINEPSSLEDIKVQSEATQTKKKQKTCKKKDKQTKYTMNATNQKSRETWEENFLKLKTHLKEYGNDAQLQKNPTNAPLIRWVNQQKKEYRELQSTGKSKLAPSQIQRLNDIGFQFTSRRRYGSWTQRMKEFLEFKQTVGHGRVPVQHPTLGSWVHEQRRQYKLYLQKDPKTKMTAQRVSELERAGFLFEVAKKNDPNDARGSAKTWDERFEELKQFKLRYGHTVVPQHYPKLGWWVNTQRKEHKKMISGKKSSLTGEKIMKLTKIDFVFDASAKKGYSGNNSLIRNIPVESIADIPVDIPVDMPTDIPTDIPPDIPNIPLDMTANVPVNLVANMGDSRTEFDEAGGEDVDTNVMNNFTEAT